MDYIIGGQERLGQGWKMLMTALAAGRGISLPSLSAAGAALCGAHHRRLCADPRAVRHRRSANSKASRSRSPASPATAYLLDAARRLTCAALNQGHHPAVISGIMKLQATERMRIAIDDAMDIHGGKAVIDGPQNYLGSLYRSVPVGITVEGANILTRNLIVFGQGAIRAHPYLLAEMNALGEAGPRQGPGCLRQGVLETCRSQRGHAVPGLGPQLDRRRCSRRRPRPATRPDFIASSRAIRRPSRCAPTWRC